MTVFSVSLWIHTSLYTIKRVAEQALISNLFNLFRYLYTFWVYWLDSTHPNTVTFTHCQNLRERKTLSTDFTLLFVIFVSFKLLKPWLTQPSWKDEKIFLPEIPRKLEILFFVSGNSGTEQGFAEPKLQKIYFTIREVCLQTLLC